MKNFNIILTDKGIDSICFTVVMAAMLKYFSKIVKETMSYRKHYNECLIKTGELAVKLSKIPEESGSKDDEESG